MLKKNKLFAIITLMVMMAFAVVAVSASAETVNHSTSLPPCLERCDVVPVTIVYGSDETQNSADVLQALKEKQSAELASTLE